jgi:hypothetical protein
MGKQEQEKLTLWKDFVNKMMIIGELYLAVLKKFLIIFKIGIKQK